MAALNFGLPQSVPHDNNSLNVFVFPDNRVNIEFTQRLETSFFYAMCFDFWDLCHSHSIYWALLWFWIVWEIAGLCIMDNTSALVQVLCRREEWLGLMNSHLQKQPPFSPLILWMALLGFPHSCYSLCFASHILVVEFCPFCWWYKKGLLHVAIDPSSKDQLASHS